MEPLNDLVLAMRRDRNRRHNALVHAVRGSEHWRPDDFPCVPWFDPDGGGVNAKILVLLEAPGPKSVEPKGSGIISADNNDGTAENFFRLREEAGLRRDQLVAWNIVPWFLAKGESWKNATPADVAEAATWLDRVFDLLPSVRLVVLMGLHAQSGWTRYRLISARARETAFEFVSHPSPQNLNTRPGNCQEILEAFRRAAAMADARL